MEGDLMATNTLEWKVGLCSPGQWFVWRRVNGEVRYWADEEGTDRWSYDDAREIARSLNGPE